MITNGKKRIKSILFSKKEKDFKIKLLVEQDPQNSGQYLIIQSFMKLFKNNNFINKELVRIEGKEYMFYH